jgi:hypothetical protein
MREVDAKHLNLVTQVFAPLSAEFNRALSGGLHIFVDRAFAQGILQGVEEIGDALITQARHTARRSTLSEYPIDAHATRRLDKCETFDDISSADSGVL